MLFIIEKRDTPPKNITNLALTCFLISNSVTITSEAPIYINVPALKARHTPTRMSALN